MAGFDWNEFYIHFETKMKKAYPKCKVGRYVTPKKTDFPYVDVALVDNSGGNYDLSGNEGSQKPLIAISVYSTGGMADGTCCEISNKAKEIMLINIVITSLIYLRSIRDKERCFDSFTGLHHDVFKATGIA